MSPRDALLAGLRTHALVVGEVTLVSGATASYYVDARRALLLPGPFAALGELVAAEARRLGAVAVGGPTLGADPIACAAIAADDGLKAFFVRKERKQHGLQRWIEGPEIAEDERALVVEDVVTTGGSLITAIERLREEGVTVAGALVVVDRLAGGAEAVSRRSETWIFPTCRCSRSTTCIPSGRTASPSLSPECLPRSLQRLSARLRRPQGSKTERGCGGRHHVRVGDAPAFTRTSWAGQGSGHRRVARRRS